MRADQAQQTRRRVLESAPPLVVDRGYAGTTVAAVADHAGVSPETIYLSLGTVELAWTPDQHRDWLTHLLHTELLRASASNRR